MPRIAYAISTIMKPGLPLRVKDKQHPCPEFLHYANTYAATIISPESVKATDPGLALILERRGLLPWGVMNEAASQDVPFEAIIAGSEEIGAPLALHFRCTGKNTPVLMITHGFLFNIDRVIRSIAESELVYFLCLSASLRKRVIEQFGVPPLRVINSGYSVDTKFFAGRTLPVRQSLVASAGTANRDYRTLIRAIEGLPLELRIAADSEWRPRRLDIQGDSLPQNVVVESCQNYVNLRRLYSEALFIVVPLYPAPYACGYAVIAEAMAMGRAVIATRTECSSDFIEDGLTGFYVRPGDHSDLREKIEYLLSNPDRAISMGREGRRLVTSKYSNRAYCSRINGLVMRVLQRHMIA